MLVASEADRTCRASGKVEDRVTRVQRRDRTTIDDSHAAASMGADGASTKALSAVDVEPWVRR